MAMDGGSIMLHVLDTTGANHRLLLVQRAFLSGPHRLGLPGRIYLDDVLIPVRSPDEAALLGFLQNPLITASTEPPPPHTGGRIIIGDHLKAYFAAVDRSPADAIRHLVNEMLTFVESDEYVHLAGRTSGGPTTS
jgi:hypothetical protein